MKADGTVRSQGTLSSGSSGPLLPKTQIGLLPLSSLAPAPSKHLLGREAVPRETDPVELEHPSSPVAMVTQVPPTFPVSRGLVAEKTGSAPAPAAWVWSLKGLNFNRVGGVGANPGVLAPPLSIPSSGSH